jgi:uncharacterized cupredoxin-like copper-binding protein
MKMTVFAVLAVAVVSLAGFACSGDDDSSDDGGTAGVREIEVTLTDDLAIEPSEIELESGEPVRLIVSNSGSALHDFSVVTIPVSDVSPEEDSSGGHMMDSAVDYDLHIAVEGGEEGILEFTPTESGEFEVVCTVTGHADAGMVGTLVVS